MIDPGIRAAFDQTAELVGETFPALWKRVYDNCVKEGFTEEQAMELVKTLIGSLAQGTIR